MTILENIVKRAQHAPKKIVLTEGEDPRILQAAERLSQERVADVTVLGNDAIIRAKAAELGLSLADVLIVDPETSTLRKSLGDQLFELRAKKGMTEEKAYELAGQPLWFANLSVKAGHQDGVVSGAVHTTGDVVRAAIQVIGVDKAFKMISSFFLMVLDQPHHPKQGSMVFSDCGLVIDPNAEQLAEIASAAANSYQAINGEAANVAMLSFSTQGSAAHPDVDKVVEATRLVKAARPELNIDGEVQLDAAVVPAIAESKINNSEVAGLANVLVFPSLEAGNIAYKLVERFAGATAIGPLLQGLAQPANDLSRGCSADDVYYVAAVTVVQAQA
ncbi:MAG: phosphate acetyltransferase [Leucothrix sp.]